MYTTDAYLIFSLIISLGGGFFIARWLYAWPWAKHRGSVEKWLFGLRAVAIALVLLFLFNPVIQRRSMSLQKPRLDVLIDNSQSIVHVSDSLEWQQIANRQNDVQEALSHKFDVHISLFDDGISSNTIQRNDGLVTNVSKSLKQIDQDDFQTAAMILVSDGNYNQGENPVFVARQLSFPVYSVIVGDTLPKAMVHIQNVVHNPVGYQNEKNPIELELRFQGISADTTVNIQLFEDDKFLIEKSVRLDANQRGKNITLYFEPGVTGVRQYRAFISGNEQQQRFFYMEIKKQKQKVLILYHAVHPDIGAVQRALMNSNRFEPVIHQASKFSGKVNDYAVVILHQLPSGDFFEDKWFADVLEYKVPYWIIVGESTDFPLFNQGQALLRLTNFNGEYEEAGVLLSNDFSWFRINSPSGFDFSDFPPLVVPFADYRSLKGKSLFSQTLYGVETGRQAWVFGDKPYRSSILCGTGLWRWRMDEFRKSNGTLVIDDLVYKVVRFLSVDEAKKRLVVDYEKIYSPAQPIRIEAVWYNENFERDNRIAGEVHVFDSSNIKYEFKFWPKNDYYVAEMGSLQPGNYRFSAVFNSDEKQFVDSGRFVVSHLNIEAYSNMANEQVMRSISGNDGFFTLADTDRLIELLKSNDSFPSVRSVVLRFDDIINQYFLLFVVLILLFSEWLIRKYNGI